MFMQKRTIVTGILGAALLIGGGIGVVYANKPTEPATVVQADATQAPVVEPKVEPQAPVEEKQVEAKPVETKTEPIAKAPVKKVETQAPAKTTTPDPNAVTKGKLVLYLGGDQNLVYDYVGETKDGKANGHGTMTSRKTGGTWTGNFMNNSPAGEGKSTRIVDGEIITETIFWGI
ncbi:hypothetical protein DesyoDRAFT_2144 [Desulfosporosinus youngiae DSM 17734]|uniref:MORN repeat protein n=2 Tax=Desulfosporosinus TaxID=79206 RepID=H5XUS2_9FIRM|nr:hypothetical protein DesyoDRAFT_2144 [Desulfosporosinus youngiae DSM 17734]